LHFVGDVTFTEFVQYVINQWSSGKKLDMHWMPQYQHCNPCLIKYDFIGRFEKLQDDIKHVIAKLIAKRKWIKLPSLNRHHVPVSVVKHIYGNLSRNIVQELISMYKNDYELFGYDYHWACNNC